MEKPIEEIAAIAPPSANEGSSNLVNFPVRGSSRAYYLEPRNLVLEKMFSDLAALLLPIEGRLARKAAKNFLMYNAGLIDKERFDLARSARILTNHKVTEESILKALDAIIAAGKTASGQ